MAVSSSGPTSLTLGSTTLALGSTTATVSGLTLSGTSTWNGNKIGLAYGGTNADLSATGGTSQFLKQASSGAAVTVVQPTFADIASGSTAATATGLTLSGGTLSGATTLPGSGSLTSSGDLQIGSARSLGISTDTMLFRGAAGRLDLRNGTNAQGLRLYNTYTDASNGEWSYNGSWLVTANVATYGTDKNGTGTARNVQLLVGGTVRQDFGVTSANTWSFVSNALTLTGNPGNTSLNVLSGSAGNVASVGIGRVAGDGDIGAPAGANQFVAGSGAGDITIRTLAAGNILFSRDAGVTANLKITSSGLVVASSTLLTTSVALTNGAGALTGTLTNAPAAGNPTKWIPINDNGTTRYIPAW